MMTSDSHERVRLTACMCLHVCGHEELQITEILQHHIQNGLYFLNFMLRLLLTRKCLKQPFRQKSYTNFIIHFDFLKTNTKISTSRGEIMFYIFSRL